MVLADLTAGAVEDAARRELQRPLRDVERDALAQAPATDARKALAPADRVKIIAEVKRSSPSRGRLAEIPDPALQASLYQRGGASAISVLTEERRFDGSLADLDAVVGAVSLPVLRKDFIATPYQVLEARAAGASLALLIVAGLDRQVLGELYLLIRELGMTPLVETHSAEELEIALDLGAEVIGVNARDLRTLELDRDLFGRLSDRIPSTAVKIAESAVLQPADVEHYRRAGADVVLIGEALVTGDPVTTLQSFLDAGDFPVSTGAAR
ncbi:indole-3-glycerol phosphate synthase TrpC [Microbacterium pseudoresistens]|uniref:indole-3-glycerol-phosphate synthase n=1 Tax=Microbacterium pseudoresistens TaxID=640634 RepID=A0A7Y9EWW8_9MICO|nr:indole-3-glycerol phosphate synthase TrpC [Microbacterium pseudoresistens]NYD55452.1 indole-3-glycerol phosphate synthase [Microbacterium pseudoresistens]